MDNCKYRHILFLSYKDICYNSTSYFEQRISEELINAGIKVTHLNIPKPAKGLSGTLADTAYMLLKPYFNADLDAIIDINTTIPCIKYNNGYILNNFDIPIGIEHSQGDIPDIPSATQWTSAIDLTNRKVYYKTAYNNSIRCIDLKSIDFSKVKYQSQPLDKIQEQPVEMVKIPR